MTQNNKRILTPSILILLIWFFATCFWWAFAFLSLPTPTPGWLDRAREVCFGNTPSGLPDEQGWMTLIVPSVFMLISTIVVFKDELQSSVKLIFSRARGRALASLLLCFFLIEAMLITKVILARWPVKQDLQSYSRPIELPIEYPKTNIKITNFKLINQENQSFSQEDLKGHKTILTFAFANCDTICPLIVQNSIQVLKSQADDKLQLVIITLDPWRDRPSRLAAAIKLWKAPKDRTHFLSGSIADVQNVLKSFNIPFSRDKKTGFVSHPALVYLINEDGKIAFSFNNPTPRWLSDGINRI